MQRLALVVLAFWIVMASSSCGNVKNLQILQGSFDTTQLSKIEYKEPLIQKGDLLSITVFSDDPLATAAVVNQMVPASPTNQLQLSGTNNSSPATNYTSNPGFQVNQNGIIQVYKLGNIYAAGKTKEQLADTLAYLYNSKQLLQNPYVEVRLLNYKITLLGEVAHPGTYTFPTDRVNALEAIGMAGDLTVFGRRDNVMVIREVNGVREFGRLDFSKPEVIKSPYFNLQQNDMLIVDVAKNKSAVNDQITVRNITIATSILSTIAIFLNIFRR